ncbi:hypothetical protein BDF14DRAFT_1805945 [Spinellus fusiger]|nr:hypothetical protein BDF14DRAFT_1805945 [Spinellus fusiger]
MQNNKATHVKRIRYFNNNKQTVTVLVQEALDPAYGCYIWPSALLMGDYVWYHRKQFMHCTVLEVGAGTSLPSLVLASTEAPPRLIISDLPSILPVIHACLDQNALCPDPQKLWVCGLVWGETGSENSIDQLIAHVSSQRGMIDYILGSDTFYDPSDFEKLIMVVAYVMHRHNKQCRFITAYQERSAKRSLQYLLDKWHLKCRLIPRDSFAFNEYRFAQETDYTLHAGTLSSVFLLEITAQ